MNGAELHDSVDGVDREAVPLGPPAAPRVTQSFVGWMLEKELNVVDTGSIGVDTIGVGGCQSRVDTNKVPTGPSSAVG